MIVILRVLDSKISFLFLLLLLLPSSAEAQAQAQLGLSWLYSQLIQPPPPARESFFSAPAKQVRIVKRSRQPQ